MKKIIAFILCCLACLSMAACADRKPSDDEIVAAINEGRIAVTDALKDGLITEEWLIEHDLIRVAKDPDKMGMNMGAFSQESIGHGTIDNKYFDDFENGCYTLFFTPDSSDGITNITEINKLYDFLSENDIGVLALCDGEITDSVKELAGTIEFPIIQLSAEMKEPLGDVLIPSITKVSQYGIFCSGWMMGLPELEDFKAMIQEELSIPKVEFDKNDPYDGIIFE